MRAAGVKVSAEASSKCSRIYTVEPYSHFRRLLPVLVRTGIPAVLTLGALNKHVFASWLPLRHGEQLTTLYFL